MHRTKVSVVEEALDANNTIATANRADFDRHGVTVINFMSAPGAGKTTLLERVVADLPGVRVGVLEGDVQGSMDADRLATLHIPVTSSTPTPSFGGECHLDANMVRSAMPSLPLHEIDLLVIENVGNLVCPAEFRVGEDARVMVCSVTEGEDKPLKYPLMFRACELVIVNKIDLLPHLDFDLELLLYNIDQVNPAGREDRAQRAHRRGDRGVARVAGAGRGAGGALCVTGPPVSDLVDALVEERSEANRRFFGSEAERLARLCHLMAERFARGGRLVAFGCSPARALGRPPRRRRVRAPGDRRQAGAARDRAGRGGRPARPAGRAARRPDDIAIAFGARRRRGAARRRRPGARMPDDRASARSGAEWEFEPPSADPDIRQELVETLYHVLWELVHVFFEHRGLLERPGRAAHPRRRRVELPVPVPGRAGRSISRRCSTTCAARC